jgi:protein-S-isoprenylcysteine O-methyltransferase Ste14
MTDKSKGWILAFIQFVLFAVIVISSALEFKYLNRPLVPVIHYIGVTLILLATLFFTVVVLNFGQMITPNPVPLKKAVLRTNGVYRFVRHPMYTSALVMSLGIVLYFQAYYSFILLGLLFVFFIIKSSAEERFLLIKFPEYSEYRTRTKRLIPFLY